MCDINFKPFLYFPCSYINIAYNDRDNRKKELSVILPKKILDTSSSFHNSKERKSIQSLKKLIPQDISFRNDYYFDHGLLNLDLLISERKKEVQNL